MDRTRELLHNGGGYDLIHGKLSPGASYEQVAAAISSPRGPRYRGDLPAGQHRREQRGICRKHRPHPKPLAGIAIIVLIISAFITYNTFTLVMGQRIRELGLLRVLGAERRQIAQVVAVEALIVGVVATILGFGIGIMVALGIASALNSAGAHLPPST